MKMEKNLEKNFELWSEIANLLTLQPFVSRFFSESRNFPGILECSWNSGMSLEFWNILGVLECSWNSFEHRHLEFLKFYCCSNSLIQESYTSGIVLKFQRIPGIPRDNLPLKNTTSLPNSSSFFPTSTSNDGLS
jgi:hypothetical protein